MEIRIDRDDELSDEVKSLRLRLESLASRSMNLVDDACLSALYSAVSELNRYEKAGGIFRVNSG